MQFISLAIFGPLQELGTLILAYREAEAAMLNYNELLQKPIEKRPKATINIGPLQHLRFEEVLFRHQEAPQNALDGISFEAATGDTLAFVGPSGSATSALDSLTEEEITSTVREVLARREQITVLIAHRHSTIMPADTIYVLEKGKIVEQGSHDHLVILKGLYFAMWRQQIGERKEELIN